MFGLGWMEISAILVIALVVFGPKKLPELARKLGEGIREFKNASESFKAAVNEEAHRPPPSGPTYNDHDDPKPPEQLADGSDASGNNGHEDQPEPVEEKSKDAVKDPAKS